jgi:hypothetical protein
MGRPDSSSRFARRPREEAMFEQELELEKKESSIVPLILILGLAGVIVGSIVYWVLQMRKSMTPEQASAAVTQILKAQGPVVLHFHTGAVAPSVNEKPRDPHYRLLEKAGLVKTSAGKGDLVNVALTPKGEETFKAIPGFEKRDDPDGTVAMFVPLASKKLVQVSKVTMTGPNVATIEYTWQWETTPIGDLFDANSALVKTFNIWDTQTLINKYDASFYHGDPAKAVVRLVRGDNDKWSVAAE